MGRNEMGGMGGSMPPPVQGSELPKFGGDLLNGPLGQIFAMNLMIPKMQQMQQAVIASPTLTPQNQVNLSSIPSNNLKSVPAIKDVGGAPTAISEVKEKTDLPESIGKSLADLRTHADTMQKAAQQVILNKDLQGQMGPLHPSAQTGWIGNTAMSARGVGEELGGIPLLNDPNKPAAPLAEFKSAVENTRLETRKSMEGLRLVSGGVPLIDAMVPQTKDVPHQFVGKTLGTLAQMNEQYNRTLEWAKSQNYKLGDLDQPFPASPESLRDLAKQNGMQIPEYNYKNASPIPGQTQQATPGGDSARPSQASSDPNDGKIIVNQMTKARFKRTGGQWVPIQKSQKDFN